MTGKIAKIVCLLLFAAFLMTAGLALARRPGPGEVATHRCQQTVYLLHQALERLSQTQIELLTGKKKGVQPVSARVLKFLMDCDPEVETNELFDLVMELEAGVSNCHYYIVFNFEQPFKDEVFVACDNKHAFYRNVELERDSQTSPRGLFKALCQKFDTLDAYEVYAEEFLEETDAEQQRKKVALSRNNGFIAVLASYWWLLPILGLLDFIFVDLSCLKTAGEGTKLYCLGLYMTCVMVFLSFVTIYYTNTPVPDFRDFGHLPDGSYPKELHRLSDVILYTSFGWWGISILTVAMAGNERGLRLLALSFVVFGPMAFALSEQPFGGTEKLAYPILGAVLALINAFYIRSWSPKAAAEQPESSEHDYN
ncbi:MAG: hypothetical protein ACD_39C01522G0002 [uncultured bacterium]|nr:MAG: hypothetical protein ACD_39C01522G0002 [uncultured bacterium]